MTRLKVWTTNEQGDIVPDCLYYGNCLRGNSFCCRMDREEYYVHMTLDIVSNWLYFSNCFRGDSFWCRMDRDEYYVHMTLVGLEKKHLFLCQGILAKFY